MSIAESAGLCTGLGMEPRRLGSGECLAEFVSSKDRSSSMCADGVLVVGSGEGDAGI